jgi:renalase
MWDVVVIGAGLAGLTAAQHLQRHGYRVLVLEKSRGLGGRLATRRIDNQPIDHGCRYFQNFDLAAEWTDQLLDAGILTHWAPARYRLCATEELQPSEDPNTYLVAPLGMTAVAKVLAVDIPIHRRCRVTRLQLDANHWTLEWCNAEDQPETALARGVMAAIPAPQIIPLIGLSEQTSQMEPLRRQLGAVQFDPVITVMAGYGEKPAPVPPQLSSMGLATPPPGWMIFGDDHPTLRWVGLDSSKRPNPAQPVVVLHSTPTFANQYLSQDMALEEAGQALLEAALGGLGEWLPSPIWHQTHRWRYGFARGTNNQGWLSHDHVPGFVACGDWCLGSTAMAALESGRRAGAAMMQQLSQAKTQ